MGPESIRAQSEEAKRHLPEATQPELRLTSASGPKAVPTNAAPFAWVANAKARASPEDHVHLVARTVIHQGHPCRTRRKCVAVERGACDAAADALRVLDG